RHDGDEVLEPFDQLRAQRRVGAPSTHLLGRRPLDRVGIHGQEPPRALPSDRERWLAAVVEARRRHPHPFYTVYEVILYDVQCPGEPILSCACCGGLPTIGTAEDRAPNDG